MFSSKGGHLHAAYHLAALHREAGIGRQHRLGSGSPVGLEAAPAPATRAAGMERGHRLTSIPAYAVVGSGGKVPGGVGCHLRICGCPHHLVRGQEVLDALLTPPGLGISRFAELMGARFPTAVHHFLREELLTPNGVNPTFKFFALNVIGLRGIGQWRRAGGGLGKTAFFQAQ